MPRGIRKNRTEEVSTTDLGVLQKEIHLIAEETRQLKEKEKELARRKADVEKNMAKALKELGIMNLVSPRGDSEEKPKRGRPAKKAAKPAAASKKPGKRYTDEERKAAVDFVDKAIKGGSSVSGAIDQYNKQEKPRGKSAMNYQSLLRWRVA